MKLSNIISESEFSRLRELETPTSGTGAITLAPTQSIQQDPAAQAKMMAQQAKTRMDQKKQIQDQIKQTQDQIKDLQAQLVQLQKDAAAIK